ELTALRRISAEIGAITSFTGLVRDINDDDAVSSLFLEHYPGMTEKQIGLIVAEASQRWQVIGATVIHRVGLLTPGDEIVFVAVASRHRGDAFDAAEFIMDYLKTRATFWKKEQTQEGDRWLTTRESDVEAAAEWQLPDGQVDL
ncbi:MAG: molybdopterin synthase catalytic subunit MoaE, partial [Pseudomonadales bacterium]|nr:molybdopterin synthase catalytic subunit MoaE [Pseudomonadales bacterium]